VHLEGQAAAIELDLVVLGESVGERASRRAAAASRLSPSFSVISVWSFILASPMLTLRFLVVAEGDPASSTTLAHMPSGVMAEAEARGALRAVRTDRTRAEC
jgi:hypothetical protein